MKSVTSKNVIVAVRSSLLDVSVVFIGMLLAAVTLAPIDAWAEPILFYGDSRIKAFAKAEAASTYTDNPDGVRLPPGDPTEVEAFVHPPEVDGWGPFEGGKPTGLSSIPFASALMNGAGFGGVGVSAQLELQGDPLGFGTLEAIISRTGRITNVGDSGPITLTYTIPQIEIAVTGTRFEGQVANARSFMNAQRFTDQGELAENYNFFDYRLTYEYEKPPTTFAIETWTASSDLLSHSGGLHAISEGFWFGRRIDPFTVTQEIALLGAGEWIEYTYTMQSFFVVGREGGGHALYGDPFEITGGSSRDFFEFSAATAVPEPASMLLLGSGLLMALCGARRGDVRRSLPRVHGRNSDKNEPAFS